MMVHVCATLRLENDIVRILMITPGVMSAHYSIEYRTHFTHMHQTVIGVIGATEQLLIIMTITLLSGIYSNEVIMFTPITIPYINYETNARDLTVLFACLSGFHYNLENIIVSIMASREKGYAFGCILPYALFFAMMYTSSLSQLYADYVAYFIVNCGFHLTWVTAIYNLNSTAGAKFDWLFIEPWIYLTIVYLDCSEVLNRQGAIAAYVGFFLYTLVRYLLLMNNI